MGESLPKVWLHDGCSKNCTKMYCTALHATKLKYSSVQCRAVHCTALHCTALHCTVHCPCVIMIVISMTHNHPGLECRCSSVQQTEGIWCSPELWCVEPGGRRLVLVRSGGLSSWTTEKTETEIKNLLVFCCCKFSLEWSLYSFPPNHTF